MGKLSDQLTLPYAGKPGYKENSTSREAAYAMAPRAKTLCDRIYRAIKEAGARGLTADESAQVIGSTVLASRPRVSELYAMGLIRKSPARRLSSTGKWLIVWIAV